MKKKSLFFLGVVCIIGLFSCTKNLSRLDGEKGNPDEIASGRSHGNCDCTTETGSTFFDPTVLFQRASTED